MSERDLFSGRAGLRPMAIVHDNAPIGFRHSVIGALKAEIIASETVIGIVQRGTTLPFPKGFVTDRVVMPMIEQCMWWRVFDVAEAGYAAIHKQHPSGVDKAKEYERAINESCRANNLGWQMEGGRFVVVASIAQYDSVARTIDDLYAVGLKTSASELREAHRDLSRRPQPDISGAMQHAGAAIECLSREVSGDTKLTFGDIIKRNDGLFPGAYRKMAEVLWGILSNQGRHLSEEGEPILEEALFVVGTVTNLAAYLLARSSTRS